MKPNALSRLLPLAFLALIMGQGAASGDGDDAEADEDGPEVTMDTCGKLAGHRVTFRASITNNRQARGDIGHEMEFSIDMEVIARNEGSLDTTRNTLLGWSEYAVTDGTDSPFSWKVRARKDSLRLYDEDKLLAEFIYGKGSLSMAPGFRKRIIRELEKDTATFWAGGLLGILEKAGWEDKHILQVLRLYGIRDSIRQGYMDAMIASLGELSPEAADDTLARYCKSLSDSLAAAKRDAQPLKLMSAKRVGTILQDPVYPPLDSPSVFWKDSLLAVVQEGPAKPRMMRVYNPVTGKWGKSSPVKYPESALSKMHLFDTRFEDDKGRYVSYCWSELRRKPEEGSGEGLDCSPLIALEDSIDGGSIRNFSDLARAGGSSAAGWGQHEFRDGGSLYNIADPGPTDFKVKWDVFPGPLLVGSRKYDFEPTRDFPVVVSPYQDWVAYALASKDGKSKELWVARLKYR